MIFESNKKPTKTRHDHPSDHPFAPGSLGGRIPIELFIVSPSDPAVAVAGVMAAGSVLKAVRPSARSAVMAVGRPTPHALHTPLP